MLPRSRSQVSDDALVSVEAVGRHTPARLVINPTHYDGPSTSRVLAPPPLGRMGAKMMELAPVAHRAIEFYAALAEVAR